MADPPVSAKRPTLVDTRTEQLATATAQLAELRRRDEDVVRLLAQLASTVHRLRQCTDADYSGPPNFSPAELQVLSTYRRLEQGDKAAFTRLMNQVARRRKAKGGA